MCETPDQETDSPSQNHKVLLFDQPQLLIFSSYNILPLNLKNTLLQGFDVTPNHAVDDSICDLWKVCQ